METKQLKLKLLFEPAPKCPYCRDTYGEIYHLVSRLDIEGNIVYDCPNCKSRYEEEKGEEK